MLSVGTSVGKASFTPVLPSSQRRERLTVPVLLIAEGLTVKFPLTFLLIRTRLLAAKPGIFAVIAPAEAANFQGGVLSEPRTNSSLTVRLNLKRILTKAILIEAFTDTVATKAT